MKMNSKNETSVNKEITIQEECLGERKFMCNICEKTFTKKTYLDRHLQIHSGLKPYECPTCHKRFTQKAHLIEHLIIHTNDAPFVCPTCSQQFRQKGGLNRHMRTHSGVKSYDCPTCQKKFFRQGDVKRHLIIHSGDKPYECPTCNRHFSDKSSLRRHNKIHFGAKRLVCSNCQETFTHNSNLEKHMKQIHLNEKPYTCDSCKKRFAFKCTLINHLSVHRDDNKQIFNEAFACRNDRKRCLKKHLKKKENFSEPEPHLQQNDGMVKQETDADSQPNGSDLYFEVPLLKQEWITQHEHPPSCSYQDLNVKQEPTEIGDPTCTPLPLPHSFIEEETEIYRQ